MRLGGRLAAAIEVLDDIARTGRAAADALKDWGRSHRFAGSGDRAAIGNIVFDALRTKRSAGWLFDSDAPRALGFGALLLEWSETPEGLNAAFAGDKFAPAPLSDDEIGIAGTRRLVDAPPEIRADIPDWCIPFFQAAFGEEWMEEGAALAARPPLDLRVNTLKADRATVLAELAGTGAAPTLLAPHGIRIPPIEGAGRHPNVQTGEAFEKGWFEVQDEGSQLVAALAAASPSMQVLDYCAGAGGKTLALSASIENRGQIFAHDSDKVRLTPIFERLRRADVRNVQVVPDRQDLAGLEGRMDLVLVDAPCTGSGTWRRHPDTKWRLSQEEIDLRVAQQSAILDAARAFVRPGGRLVYITCSVFPAENTDQVGDFLLRHPDFQPVDPSSLGAGNLPNLRASARMDGRGGLSLSPLKTGTDGFYLAALCRAG